MAAARSQSGERVRERLRLLHAFVGDRGPSHAVKRMAEAWCPSGICAQNALETLPVIRLNPACLRRSCCAQSERMGSLMNALNTGEMAEALEASTLHALRVGGVC